MPPLNRNRFLILAATVSILLTAPAAAINLEPVDNNRVWLNEDAQGQVFEATCESRENKRFYLNSSESSFEGELDTKTLRSQIEDTGVYNLTLNCYDETDEDDVVNSTDRYEILYANELDLNFNSEGKGFVTENGERGVLEQDSWLNLETGNKEPIEIGKLEGKRENDELSDILSGSIRDNFEFGQELTLGEEDVELEDNVVLTPAVNEYFDTTQLSVIDNSGNIITEEQVDPHIYRWTYSLVGGDNPSRRIDFQKAINGEYSYLLEMNKISEDGSRSDLLLDQNFRLSVLVKEKDGNQFISVDELDGVDDEIQDKKWLEWEKPGGQPGTHRVSLDNVKELEGLPDRQYKFFLEFDKEWENGRGSDSFVIDQVLVDKQSQFSGRVADAQGSGVETVMRIRGTDRNVRVSTGQDGYYAEEISVEDIQSMTMDFYKRGKVSSDSSVVVESPDLEEDSDLGRGGSAVKFDYWSDPNVDITGVDPVNMMAVKFGYPINSFDSATVKFDPSGINPENLQVYECSFWNFEGSSCLGSWEQIDDNGFSVNMGISPPDVHISELEPYTTPDEDGESQDILMNAYVLGTSADIGIRDTLTIGGQTNGRIRRGGSLEFSGFIEDQKGNLVSGGIPVEVELEKPDNSESYDGETDSNGKFVIDAEAPDEPGNYTVTLSSEPDIYDGFSIEYSKPLAVYTEREVSLDVPDSFTMQKGEEKVMEFEVRNTGQADLTVNELIADGMSTDFFSWVEKFSGEIEPGESRTAEIRFDLPDAYTDSYPSLGLRAVASSGGQTVEFSTTAQIRARDVVSDTGGQESEENGSENTTQNQSSQDFEESSPGEDLAAVTGNFIQSTSNVNLALGLLMVLMMIVAGAVRKKKDDAGNRRGSRRGDRGRPQVGGMNVSPQNEGSEDGADKEDLQDEDEVEEEEQESEEEEEKFVDEETGKEFDTKEALELFQEMQD